MSDPSTADPRLAELRRRREADPSPRVFLQLAEEYRRQGRHDDALVVLESGLAEVPGYLSLQVSLGRLRLDRGEGAQATAALERVVARDPTHLVAAKLLVEACLLTGDAEGARLRLDRYRLLNDGDPEIDELAERIALMGRGRGAAGPPLAAVEAEEQEEELGRAEEPDRGLAAGPGLAAERLAPAAGGDDRETAGRPAVPEPAVSLRTGDEPFADLLVPDRRRYLAGLARGGIFPVALPPEPEPPAVEAAAESALELEAPAPVAEEPIEWAWETAPAEAAAEPVAAEVEPAAFAAADADAPEAAVEPAADVPVEGPLSPYPASLTSSSISLPSVPETLAAAELPAVPGAEPVATVTLGQLYLEQQHFGEAERIFRAVLARDPGNAAALLGLAEASQGRPAPLDAADLLRWVRDSGRAAGVPRAPGALGARLAVLHAYQTRLAAAREKESDVS